MTLASPWDGGTRTITLGTDDVFLRRVVIVNAKTGKPFEAPWDTLAPLPLGKGETWLLWRCALQHAPDGGPEDEDGPLELLAWTPRTGRTIVLGTLPGDARTNCPTTTATTTLSVATFPDGGLRWPGGSQSVAWQPAVLPRSDGALALLARDGGSAQWVQLDARARIVRAVSDAGAAVSASPQDAGSPLTPLSRLTTAFIELERLTSVEGRPLVGGLPDGGSFPLTPSLGAGFAVHDGLVFSDEGVFRLPAKARVRVK